MKASKYQKHRELINKINAMWNTLTLEERLHYKLFLGNEMLTTIWKVINKEKDLMCPKCKRDLLEWADNIAKQLQEEYRIVNIKKVDVNDLFD